MAANVEFDFPNYFEVDEEKLRRIHSIIKKRLPEKNKETIEFIIKKSDNFIYHTKNIIDIINEPNDSTSKINSIKINYNSENMDIAVLLSNKTGASINVSGENRDDVFLLSSELKEYISKEVANITKMKWMQARTISSIIMLLLVGYITYIFSDIKIIDANALKVALESTNPNDKLNFLINKGNKDIKTATTIVPMFILLLAVIASQIIPFEKIMNYIYPRNIFLFGKEISLIERKKRNRSNIFWVIIVGSIISLLVAFISTRYM
ncbi:hypothetical protein AWP63_22445 [Escherichia coli]|uniref:hypothetical protein n=1 Tax=Escherichia coli TaxID=562 RepID=UPI0009452315|nr:hypothetical protein [Escherichia coli]MCK2521734.1 hypothetical protein [Escherichia coli]MCK2526338.1 hypothetical protein [Escherichia coli]OKV59905.1 hypothetical protein AWP63_22445 [Escherichia coli]OKW26493.1 hypothetical protein AWP71_23155 [Escherichia coli]HAN6713169.1 hypothetical protein [Escherichia coli]